jgi:acetyltransferase-like isoleucine patch superfamily enzyme
MISPLAVVETDQIGDNVTIHEYAIVRKHVVIGDNVVIHPFVVIEEHAIIGNDVEIFPGSYIGKKPRGAGATVRPISYTPQVKIGDGCAIGPHAVIFYDVEIGNNTLIGDGASLREQVRVGSQCIISRYVTINYNTTIGDKSQIMDLTHITGNVTIGDNVFISIHVSTTNDNGPITRTYDGESMNGPQIASRATIGAGSILLPRVQIGEGAIVGSGAVVTKDIAPYDLVMGVPAKVVKNVKDAAADRSE